MYVAVCVIRPRDVPPVDLRRLLRVRLQRPLVPGAVERDAELDAPAVLRLHAPGAMIIRPEEALKRIDARSEVLPPIRPGRHHLGGCTAARAGGDRADRDELRPATEDEAILRRRPPV